jgi:hypothetical protein
MKKKLNNCHFSFQKTDFLTITTYAGCKQAFDGCVLLCAAYSVLDKPMTTIHHQM